MPRAIKIYDEEDDELKCNDTCATFEMNQQSNDLLLVF